MSNKENKGDTIRNMLFAGVVFFTLLYVGPMFLPDITPPTQTDPTQTSPTTSTTNGSGSNPATTTGSGDVVSGNAPSGNATQTSHGAGWTVLEAPEEVTVTIGSAPAVELDPDNPDPFRVRLLLSNVGASIESATMTDHLETTDSPDRYEFLRTIKRDRKSVV